VRKDKNFIPSSATLLRHIQKKVAGTTKEKFGRHLNSLKIKQKVERNAHVKSHRFAPRLPYALAPRILARFTR
jgi:hypothetical protein